MWQQGGSRKCAGPQHILIPWETSPYSYDSDSLGHEAEDSWGSTGVMR